MKVDDEKAIRRKLCVYGTPSTARSAEIQRTAVSSALIWGARSDPSSYVSEGKDAPRKTRCKTPHKHANLHVGWEEEGKLKDRFPSMRNCDVGGMATPSVRVS